MLHGWQGERIVLLICWVKYIVKLDLINFFLFFNVTIRKVLSYMANTVFPLDHAITDEHLVRNTESSTWLSFAQKPLLGSEPLLYLKVRI